MNVLAQAPVSHWTPRSPFVPFPGWARLLLIVYMTLYHVLLPALAEAFASNQSPLFFWRLLAESAYVALVLLPVIFYRREYGVLHPLIFPLLYSLVKLIFKQPAHVFLPLEASLGTFEVPTESLAVVLSYLSLDALAQARLELTLLECLGLVFYYVGFFFLPRIRVPSIRFAPSTRVRGVAIAMLTVAAVAFVVLMTASGGVDQYVRGLAGRRFENIRQEGLGSLVALVGVGTTAVIIWFAYQRRASRDPVFIAAVVLASSMAWLSSGSRSDIAVLLMMLIMVWMIRASRLPAMRAALIAILCFGLFGALGQIRRDYNAVEVNWSYLTSLDLQDWLLAASDEVEEREEKESNLAAYVGARQTRLYGLPYVHAAAFWVPRFVWPDKPRSTGAYNTWVNFYGQSLASVVEVPPTVGGRPVNRVVEAFWSFHLPGVVVVLGLFGMFHRWLASFLLVYSRVPAVWVLYVLALAQFNGTVVSFVSLTRTLVIALGILFLCGVLRWGRKGIPAAGRLAGAPR